jgi:hypothetical protein
MENQDIKWETWEEQPQDNNEQPQVNWGEQSQEENIPTWGEQPQQEQPQVNWGKQPQHELQQGWGEQPHPEDSFSWDEEQKQSQLISRNWSLIGNINRIVVDTEIFQLNSNLNEAINDLNQLDLTPLDNEGRYDFSPKKDTELGNIIKSLVEISSSRGLKIKNCFLYKNSPLESSLNIFRGKPVKQFIFFLQGDYNSGEVILDLSSLGGPSAKILDSANRIQTMGCIHSIT